MKNYTEAEKKNIITEYVKTFGNPEERNDLIPVFYNKGNNKKLGDYKRYYYPLTGKIFYDHTLELDNPVYGTFGTTYKKSQSYLYTFYDAVHEMLEVSVLAIDNSRPARNSIEKRTLEKNLFYDRVFLFSDSSKIYNDLGEEAHPEQMGKYYNKWFIKYLKTIRYDVNNLYNKRVIDDLTAYFSNVAVPTKRVDGYSFEFAYHKAMVRAPKNENPNINKFLNMSLIDMTGEEATFKVEKVRLSGSYLGSNIVVYDGVWKSEKISDSVYALRLFRNTSVSTGVNTTAMAVGDIVEKIADIGHEVFRIFIDKDNGMYCYDKVGYGLSAGDWEYHPRNDSLWCFKHSLYFKECLREIPFMKEYNNLLENFSENNIVDHFRLLYNRPYYKRLAEIGCYNICTSIRRNNGFLSAAGMKLNSSKFLTKMTGYTEEQLKAINDNSHFETGYYNDGENYISPYDLYLVRIILDDDKTSLPIDKFVKLVKLSSALMQNCRYWYVSHISENKFLRDKVKEFVLKHLEDDDINLANLVLTVIFDRASYPKFNIDPTTLNYDILDSTTMEEVEINAKKFYDSF